MSLVEWAVIHFMIAVLLIGFWVVGEEDNTGRWIGFIASLIWPLTIVVLITFAVIALYQRWIANRGH